MEAKEQAEAAELSVRQTQNKGKKTLRNSMEKRELHISKIIQSDLFLILLIYIIIH